MKSKALALLLVLFAACTKTPLPASSETVAPPPPPPPVTRPSIVFPDGTAIAIEIVADDETRAQGLMYRDQLQPNSGMLFVFPAEGDYPFWMKNTFIPLDMIWIDTQKRVAHIAHDVPPCKSDPCPSYPPNAKSLYVLEVAAGVARQHGLKDGDVLRFENVPAVTAR